ncbi:bifunctional nuclease family protein [Chlamydia muridarum str. Nigg]|jgi:Uncharacterized conserved protein|uniref:BFN domain-containing protein n=2 Tax=Chlamydia muridarum TaxID=83560 RepID=A0A070A3W9_CHLMR|nr:bifunctional nuclease family protein [Chlamydia muridarum]UFW99739.1 bifunctional nuclease family protein [Chlamydia trachomatis]AAF39330.1 conserved hypothetical protein [Chlamydia muridarum str. Nigg]AHH22871.1 hypothetical protein TAC_02550 [Chlamydia muridarum str. Nigg3 CMUT3-5]AHH23796.1 hypothetical protein Y015_02550 [Chlamydia muridarum str. Nigg CM972]AID38005.1 hypothetical protein BB17_02595 [Chlamydia muridarum str. Nigg 2 MCR]
MNIDREIIKDTSLILISFHKLVNFHNYAGIILGTEEKQFAIYGCASMDTSFKKSEDLWEEEHTRPLTHDILNFILTGFDISVARVVITDYKDNIFYSRLFLEQKRGDRLSILDIDARPSDSIPLAIKYQAPILCVKSIFDETIPYED